MKMKVTFIIIMAALGMGCSSSSKDAGTGAPTGTGTGTPGEIDASKAKEVAAAAVPGTASEPTKLDEGEEHRWVVEVALSVPNANGAVLQVEITRATGVLEEIKSVKGPFEYDLTPPGQGLMTFAQAKAKALATKAGVIEEWEVKPPENLYELYVRDANEHLWEIKMTGDKGEIQSVIDKPKAD
ncbi:MAG: hypothetical protein JWP87_3215 [Labilithrix sp.]|nr:hypothetical protein [Labilithrix sp.]